MLQSGDERAERAQHKGEPLPLGDSASDNTEGHTAAAGAEAPDEGLVVGVETEDGDVLGLLESTAARVVELERALEAAAEREAALMEQNQALAAQNQAMARHVAEVQRVAAAAVGGAQGRGPALPDY